MRKVYIFLRNFFVVRNACCISAIMPKIKLVLADNSKSRLDDGILKTFPIICGISPHDIRILYNFTDLGGEVNS